MYLPEALNARLMEYKCVEFVEELLYGHLRKEELVKHWEADLGERGGGVAVDVTRTPSGRLDNGFTRSVLKV